MGAMKELAKSVVFGDASGNDGMDLEAQGVTRYYVLAALKIPAAQRAALHAHLAEVKEQFFPSQPEMRSASVSSIRKREELVGALTDF